MLQDTEKDDLCQISLTGVRSLLLLGLLIQEPRSLDDIRKEFLKYNVIKNNNSNDILRIDINTLRDAGCEISRADHRTNNKFVLLDHPFKLKLTEDEVNVLKNAFNKIKQNADISLLMKYDKLFKKIAPHISDETLKDIVLNIVPIKKYSSEILKELTAAAKNKNTVTLIYKSPALSKESTIEMIVDRIVLQNDKLYAYGLDNGSRKPIYLNLRRVLKILSQKKGENIEIKSVTVKFKLSEFGVTGLDDNEKIISGSIAEGYIIEGNYHNEFYAIQRILSFGSRCTVLEPSNVKDKIVDVLKRMKEIYNG